MKYLRWLLFTKHERLVIRRALEGERPYIGGQEPYGAPYAPSVDLLNHMLAELRR